ncbi:DUF4292 domain-containing protein [Candidatus Sumerlaeota bacterium]|nr:DUF4292 domain-containing protein [Candidatus Sumerlaeota bacterium]
MRHAILPIVLIIVISLTACRTQQGFVSAYPRGALTTDQQRVASREDLTRVLARRTHQHDDLWVKSGITIRSEGSSRKAFFTSIVMYQAPDKLRFAGSRVPIGTLFDVLLLGDRAMVYFNRDGNLFVGSADELAKKSSAIGGLSPRDLVSAALIQQQLQSVLESDQPCVVEPQGEGHLLVATQRENSQNLFFMVRRIDGLVEEALIRNADGGEQLRIRYTKYEMVGDPETKRQEPLPSEMKLELRSEGVVIDAEVDEYRLQPKLNFTPQRARRTYPLSSMQFSEDF